MRRLEEDKYIIEPIKSLEGFGGFYVGDWINMINDDKIVGPYCEWPKQEPRQFIISEIK